MKWFGLVVISSRFGSASLFISELIFHLIFICILNNGGIGMRVFFFIFSNN